MDVYKFLFAVSLSLTMSFCADFGGLWSQVHRKYGIKDLGRRHLASFGVPIGSRKAAETNVGFWCK